jgi:hypothetical protein
VRLLLFDSEAVSHLLPGGWLISGNADTQRRTASRSGRTQIRVDDDRRCSLKCPPERSSMRSVRPQPPGRPGERSSAIAHHDRRRIRVAIVHDRADEPPCVDQPAKPAAFLPASVMSAGRALGRMPPMMVTSFMGDFLLVLRRRVYKLVGFVYILRLYRFQCAVFSEFHTSLACKMSFEECS